MQPVKIFLVDDDNIFVFLTKKTISTAGIDTEVEVFNNGQEIVDYLKKSAGDPNALPDIILLDISMPVMDGWGVLEEYKVIKPTLKKSINLNLVSSTISPHDIERAKSFSVVSDFYIKPLLREHVVELTQKLLAGNVNVAS
jgi:CheY-like chemotaxis protein